MAYYCIERTDKDLKRGKGYICPIHEGREVFRQSFLEDLCHVYTHHFAPLVFGMDIKQQESVANYLSTITYHANNIPVEYRPQALCEKVEHYDDLCRNPKAKLPRQRHKKDTTIREAVQNLRSDRLQSSSKPLTPDQVLAVSLSNLVSKRLVSAAVMPHPAPPILTTGVQSQVHCIFTPPSSFHG